MAKIERQEIVVMSAIGAMHLVVIGLLLHLLIENGIVPDPRAVRVFNVADTPDEVPTLEPVLAPLPVTVDIEAPTVELEPPAPMTPSSGAYDPFAGAALTAAPAGPTEPVAYQGTGGRPTSEVAAASEEDRVWLDGLRARFAARVAARPGAPSTVVVEVRARPSGGFSDVRIKIGTGAYDIDQELLAAVMLRQSLLPGGSVNAIAWIALSPINLRSDDTAVAEAGE